MDPAPDELPPRSPRLLFRRWRADDVALAMELWGDPRVMALLDGRDALDREAIRERLGREIDLDQRHGIQYWPLFLRSSGEFAGCAGLRPRDPARRIFELGSQLGFRHTHEEHYAPTGRLHPAYSLTREEYDQRRKRRPTGR